VGKSSLLNIMAERKALARTSGSPGKTRTINFYDINHICMLVDLPGYGYAKVSRKESENWGKMIEMYLLNRRQLLAIFLLLDIRHGLSALDWQMLDWLEHYSFEIITIATKSDKITRTQMPKNLAIIRRKLGLEQPPIPFSSETRQNRDILWTMILDNCGINML